MNQGNLTTLPPLPLSQGQQALWFIYQEAPASSAYNMALPLQFVTDIQPALIAQAVQTLVARHTILRSVFVEIEGVPYQQVLSNETKVDWQIVDASNWTETALLAQVRTVSQQPFALEKNVFRATLFVGAESGSVLLFTLHHIAGDAASLSVLGRELLQIYAALVAGKTAELAPLTHSYTDYVQWEQNLLASKKGQRMADYWQKQLAGAVPILQLPTDLPRPPVQAYNGASLKFTLSPEQVAKLRTLSKAHRSTLFSVLLSAYQVLLHRYSGQSDIWVGVPTSVPRNQAEFTDMVGYLVNPMVVRTQFADDKPLIFSQLVQQAGRQILTNLYHQPYPFSRLIEQLQPQRDPAYPPLVQVMFTYERNDLIPRTFSADNHSAKRRDVAQMEGQFDLSLTWTEEGEDKPLAGVLSYNCDLFEPNTIARLATHLQTLLASVAQDTEQSIYHLPLLTAAEQTQLQQWNQTETSYPQDQTIIDLFEQQVAKTPDNIAVVFADKSLTYQQLNEKVNQLAHHLLSLKNNPDNCLIAIAVERSLNIVIGLLGILKAGSAYVPIDPSYPAARIQHMLTHTHQVKSMLICGIACIIL